MRGINAKVVTKTKKEILLNTKILKIAKMTFQIEK